MGLANWRQDVRESMRTEIKNVQVCLGTENCFAEVRTASKWWRVRGYRKVHASLTHLSSGLRKQPCTIIISLFNAASA